MEQISVKFKRTKIKLELDDKEYLISKPVLGEIRAFEESRDKIKDDKKAVVDLSMDFLEKLGLPKDVSESLELSMFSQIIDVLFSEGKKN